MIMQILTENFVGKYKDCGGVDIRFKVSFGTKNEIWSERFDKRK